MHPAQLKRRPIAAGIVVFLSFTGAVPPAWSADAIWMYDPAEKKLLNAASPTAYGSRLNPARVWQAGTRSPASNDIEELHRDTRRLTEGQVLDYIVRDYRPAEYKPDEPAGITINSSEDFLFGGKTSNAVSVTKNGDIYRLVLDDGWELDIKIVMPSL